MTKTRILILSCRTKEVTSLRHTLINMGHEVPDVIDNGPEACATISAASPDLLLIAIHLKEQFEGLEIAEKVNQQYHLPILFLISHEASNFLEKIKTIPHEGYLLMPPSEAVLHFSIELALARHQMLETIKENQNLLSTTLKCIGDAVITTDQTGLITFLNPTAEKLTGWQADEAVGKKLNEVFNIINEKTGRKAVNPIQKILEKGIVTGLANHTLLITKKGLRIPIDDSGAPIKDENGRVRGAVLVFRDITEKRLAQTALQQEKNLLRTVIDNIPDKIYAKNTDGVFILCNTAVLERMGKSDQSEVIGKTDFDLLPRELAAQFYANEQAIIRTGAPLIGHEEPLDQSPQGLRWNLATKVPLRDNEGRIIGIVGIGRDITKRKQAEMELEQERNLLLTLLDNTPDHIYFKDLGSRFLRMSKSQAERFGLTDPKAAIGKTDFDFFTEEHARAAFRDEQKIIQSGQPVIGIEERETWPDGSETWVSTTKMPLINKDGVIVGTFGISRDITDRKKAEKDLKKALTNLQNNQKKLKNIINGSPIPQFFIDQDHKVVYWNDALAKMSGIRAEEVVGTDNHWKAFYREKRPCLPDLLIDRKTESLPVWYSDKIKKSELIEDGYSGTGFFSQLGKDGKWIYFTSATIQDTNNKIIGALETLEDITDRIQAEEQREKIIRELQEASKKINTLSGLIPICASCKKIRDDKGYWNSVESYIHEHSDVKFTHGICPDCMKKLYPEFYHKNQNNDG